jgi:putative transposase
MLGVNVGTKFSPPSGSIESVIFQDAYKVILEDCDDYSKATSITKDEFELKIATNEYEQKLIEKPHCLLTDYQKHDRDMRLKYVSTLRDLVHILNIRPTPYSSYEILIAEVEKRFPETQVTKHPGHTTVCKYWKSWIKAGFDNDALASKRRCAPTRLNAATEVVLSHYVSKVWSNSDHKVKGCHYQAYIRFANKETQKNPDVMIASERTFYRRLNELNEAEDRLNSPYISEAERNRRLLTLQNHIKTYYALQRVEVDRMHVNIGFIDDKTGKATSRLSVYIAVDCYSGAIVSVVIAFDEAENKENVLNLIRHIYLTDNNLTLGGKPSVLVMDNGSGFNNALIQKACERLNIDTTYCPSNQPSKKPFVESFNKTIKTSFFKGFFIEADNGESTVGFNSFRGTRTEKGHEPSGKGVSKFADVLKSDFIRLFNLFIAQYNNKVHKRRQYIPTMVWNESVKNVIRTQFSYNRVKTKFHVFSDKQSNALSNRGIVRCLKQTFYSDKLKQLQLALSKYSLRGKSPQVTVHYDPFDATSVTVTARISATGDEYEVTAYNISLPRDENPAPISFDELNGYEPKSMGILIDTKQVLTGEYHGHIKRFTKETKPSKKSPRSGECTEEFEKHHYPNKIDLNHPDDVNIDDRIERANKAGSSRDKDVEANIESVLQSKTENLERLPSKQKDKDFYNRTPKGKDQLW